MAQVLKDKVTAENEPTFDRRKAKRLFLNFSIEISGVSPEGEPFAERTRTEDISATGCRLVTSIPVKRGDLVDIQLAAPDGTRLSGETAQQFEVMWVNPVRSGWSIGARKVQDGNIWQVLFPPPRPSS